MPNPRLIATDGAVSGCRRRSPLLIPWPPIAFTHLYWINGPKFIRRQYQNGALVEGWPDEIGTVDTAQATATKRPIYRNAHDTMLGHPAYVDFDGTDDCLPSSNTASVAVTYSIVVICQIDAVAAQKYVIDGPNDAGTGNRFIIQASPSASTAWGIYNGTQRTGGTAAIGIHTFRAVNISGNDTLHVDGTSQISGANAGDLAYQGLTLGGSTGAVLNGQILMVGVYAGDISADGGWAAFQLWALAHYGVTF